MKLACPHCSQTLELTPDVLASLQGQPHFECPSCQGLIATPEQPRRPSASAHAKANSRAQQGMNRNFLVLGIAALVVLGVVAAFLASQNGGSITNIFQNTTNHIIHNNYFTQLIANGVTTMEDLKSIEEIRPYGDGFIGISKAEMDWESAHQLAIKTGSVVMPTVTKKLGSPISFLEKAFPKLSEEPVWMASDGQPCLLSHSQFIYLKQGGGRWKAMLAWQPPHSSTFSAEKIVYWPLEKQGIEVVNKLLAGFFGEGTSLECLRLWPLENLPEKVFRVQALLNNGVTVEALLQQAGDSLIAYGPNRTIESGLKLPFMVVPTGEVTEAALWRFTENTPSEDWMSADFDDQQWKTGRAPFGSAPTDKTPWTSSSIWLRKKFVLPESVIGAPMIRIAHDEGVKVYLNGVLAFAEDGWWPYSHHALSPAALATLKPGENTLAVLCQQVFGGQGIDLGLVDLSPAVIIKSK